MYTTNCGICSTYVMYGMCLVTSTVLNIAADRAHYCSLAGWYSSVLFIMKAHQQCHFDFGWLAQKLQAGLCTQYIPACKCTCVFFTPVTGNVKMTKTKCSYKTLWGTFCNMSSCVALTTCTR